jgi:molybdenum cofactor biosynthesis enzyme MoaA
VRSQLITTHRTCNQNCTYCNVRVVAEARADIHTGAVLSRLRDASAQKVREVVISGGEPGMRNDLPGLIAEARRGGASEVTLETNATLLDADRTRALHAAGLTLARVNLTAWGDALDAITRDPGGFDRTLAGIRALLDAGVAVEVSAVVIRATLGSLGALPEQLVNALGPSLRGLRVRVPTESPDPSQLVTYDEACAALSTAHASARRAGLSFKLSPDSGPPPCFFPQPAAVSSLYALTPGAAPRSDRAHPPPCASCSLRDRCPGVPTAYLARHPGVALRPITEDRVRRRLSLIDTVEDQVRRELAQPSRYTDQVTGEVVDETLVRVNFHCNQSCAFCFVSTHLPPATDAAVREAIVTAARAGRRVSLTGGEPTLNPRLVEYVALAREHGPHVVALQTNAVRLADPALTDALVAAGVGWAMVSLHADTAELSDALTESPGTFDKTLLGLDQLHRHAGVTLVINFVLMARNRDALLPMVRLVAARWPRAILNVSFVFASSDVVPTALVPRYADVLPQLFAALTEATALGVDVRGFDSMCGIPLCLVPAEARPALLGEIPEDYDQGEFVHPSACDGCALAQRCYGLRRSYRDLHGDAELAAVPRPD